MATDSHGGSQSHGGSERRSEPLVPLEMERTGPGNFTINYDPGFLNGMFKGFFEDFVVGEWDKMGFFFYGCHEIFQI